MTYQNVRTNIVEQKKQSTEFQGDFKTLHFDRNKTQKKKKNINEEQPNHS